MVIYTRLKSLDLDRGGIEFFLQIAADNNLDLIWEIEAPGPPGTLDPNDLPLSIQAPSPGACPALDFTDACFKAAYRQFVDTAFTWMVANVTALRANIRETHCHREIRVGRGSFGRHGNHVKEEISGRFELDLGGEYSA